MPLLICFEPIDWKSATDWERRPIFGWSLRGAGVTAERQLARDGQPGWFAGVVTKIFDSQIPGCFG